MVYRIEWETYKYEINNTKAKATQTKIAYWMVLVIVVLIVLTIYTIELIRFYIVTLHTNLPALFVKLFIKQLIIKSKALAFTTCHQVVEQRVFFPTCISVEFWKSEERQSCRPQRRSLLHIIKLSTKSNERNKKYVSFSFRSVYFFFFFGSLRCCLIFSCAVNQNSETYQRVDIQRAKRSNNETVLIETIVKLVCLKFG